MLLYVNAITENVRRIMDEVHRFPHAKLVAVVKNRSMENIRHVLAAAPKHIAFSRVQEAQEKLPFLSFPGTVHMIGRLQKNKVKKAVGIFDVIESVDCVSLAKKIDVEAQKLGKIMPVFLQVNIANDPQKAGFSEEELFQLLPDISLLSHVQICGLMTIGFRHASTAETRQTFSHLRRLRDTLLDKELLPPSATDLSMGMSNDYRIALEEGATHVRVGSRLFE